MSKNHEIISTNQIMNSIIEEWHENKTNNTLFSLTNHADTILEYAVIDDIGWFIMSASLSFKKPLVYQLEFASSEIQKAYNTEIENIKNAVGRAELFSVLDTYDKIKVSLMISPITKVIQLNIVLGSETKPIKEVTLSGEKLPDDEYKLRKIIRRMIRKF